jgi:hypothetical protein
VLNDNDRQRLLDRLDVSRRGLLDALEGVTERDFTTSVGDLTVVELLAATARAEREAVAQARGASLEGRVPQKPLPPQVMHDLAGARYQTRGYIEAPDADPAAAAELVDGVEAREAETARRIRERPRMEPPPVIPVIQP